MNYGCRNTRKFGAVSLRPARRFTQRAEAGNFPFPDCFVSGKNSIVRNKSVRPVFPIIPYSRYIVRPYSNISILGGFQ
jgi:hypothetical protein